MTLPKHLRPRYRYLGVAIEAWPDAAIDRQGLQRALWRATRGLHGDPGSAAVDPTVVRFSFEDGLGEAVVRVRRGEVGRARAALACVDAVDEEPVGIRVRGVSGTIRACEEKYIRERPIPVRERNVVFGNAERRAWVRDGRGDVRVDDAFAGATNLDFG
ncbi:MAG: Rpp14/Pop5 family protein [Halobacteriales archaeon]